MKKMKRIAALFIVLSFVMAVTAFADSDMDFSYLDDMSLEELQELQSSTEKLNDELTKRINALTEESDEKKIVFDSDEDLLADAVIDTSLPEVISLVQGALNEAGYDCGVPDGNIGPTTLTRIQSYQTDNGLTVTGAIDDAMIEKLGITDDAKIATLRANGVEIPLYVRDGWALMKEYFYTDQHGNSSYMCEVKNTSDEDLAFTGNATFYDEEGNLIGVGECSIDVCDPGCSVLMKFRNEAPFAHVEWNINSKAPNEMFTGVLSGISVETTIVGDKAIISATNNGTKNAMSVEYDALFLDENGNVVNQALGFLTDDENELKAGATIMKEASAHGTPFASVKVYLQGLAYAN